MTTQRKPDTSAKGCAWRYSINHGPDGEENYANVYTDNGELVGNLRIGFARKIVDGMNAHADAAGQAAPVPPPVEGLETPGFAIIDGVLDASDQFNETGDEHSRLIRDTLRQQAIEHFDRLTARANAEHDRAEGLAKEVERLKAAYREAYEQGSKWLERALAAEAKLAVYEAPIGEMETTADLRNTVLVGSASIHPDGLGCPCDICKAYRDINRLSAAHAECKGENTKLREAVSRARRELEHGWPVSAASTLDAALAPASEEACSHPKTVLHHTGDGTPVEFCPDCGRNVAIGNPPAKEGTTDANDHA